MLLFQFYIMKFQNLDFTIWSYISFASIVYLSIFFVNCHINLSCIFNLLNKEMAKFLFLVFITYHVICFWENFLEISLKVYFSQKETRFHFIFFFWGKLQIIRLKFVTVSILYYEISKFRFYYLKLYFIYINSVFVHIFC